MKNKFFHKIIHDNQGLTLIELAIASIISGIIIVGLSITLIAGTNAFHDDWVKNDLRNYGYYSVRKIKSFVQSATTIRVDNWNGYDRLNIIQDGVADYNVVVLEDEGFFIDDQPMDPRVKFPNGGQYREGDQRKVTIEKFSCRNLNDIEDNEFNAGYFKKLRESVWLIELKLKISTKYPGGTEGYEYLNISERFFVEKGYTE